MSQKSNPNLFPIGVLGCSTRTKQDLDQLKKSIDTTADFIGPSYPNNSFTVENFSVPYYRTHYDAKMMEKTDFIDRKYSNKEFQIENFTSCPSIPQAKTSHSLSFDDPSQPNSYYIKYNRMN
jgi:hypothetical protein